MKRNLPAAIAAEKALLGILIMYPEKIPNSIMQISPSDFYLDKHRTIFEAIVEMDLAKKPIDAITLSDTLANQVPANYISGLLDGIYKGMNIDLYIKEIKDKATLRKIIRQANELSEKAYTGDLDDTLNYFQEFKPYILQTPEEPLIKKIEEWIMSETGYFSVNDCYRTFGASSVAEKSYIRHILYTLKQAGIIEPYGQKAGQYRRVENTLETIDWKNADDQEYPIVLPLDLNRLVTVFPKSIIMIAGIFNTGKTAFCLDTIRLNQNKFKINYFSSELGPNKLRQRLKKFETVEFPDGWNFNAVYRSTNFADAIKNFGDDLNIFDYIEIGTNFWEVGETINQIFNRLNKGVAICCIQKSYGKDLGRGGDFSAEKASLYLAIDPSIIKIVKAKEWKGEINPNQKRRRFKLVQGWRFIPEGDWMTEEEEEIIKKKGVWR